MPIFTLSKVEKFKTTKEQSGALKNDIENLHAINYEAEDM